MSFFHGLTSISNRSSDKQIALAKQMMDDAMDFLPKTPRHLMRTPKAEARTATGRDPGRNGI
jgi:hypothetical protein